MNPLPPICFETICVLRRKFLNLPYHEARLNHSRAQLWNAYQPLSLRELLTVSDHVGDEKYKCRVTYGPGIMAVSWEIYLPRPIRSLQLVKVDTVDYAHKYDNRDELNRLYARRGNCDDVLIVRKGLLTDTSYANIALYDGRTWHTPKVPLLPGTQRAFLLDSGKVVPTEIGIADLGRYSAIRLFNAMLPWEESIHLSMDCLVKP